MHGPFEAEIFAHKLSFFMLTNHVHVGVIFWLLKFYLFNLIYCTDNMVECAHILKILNLYSTGCFLNIDIFI